jgi:hypothetical protein
MVVGHGGNVCHDHILRAHVEVGVPDIDRHRHHDPAGLRDANHADFLERGAGFPRIVQNQFELPFDQRIPILREAVAGPLCRTQLRSLSP